MSGLAKYHSVLRYRNQCEIQLSLGRQPKFHSPTSLNFERWKLAVGVRSAWMADVQQRLADLAPATCHTIQHVLAVKGRQDKKMGEWIYA